MVKQHSVLWDTDHETDVTSIQHNRCDSKSLVKLASIRHITSHFCRMILAFSVGNLVCRNKTIHAVTHRSVCLFCMFRVCKATCNATDVFTYVGSKNVTVSPQHLSIISVKGNLTSCQVIAPGCFTTNTHSWYRTCFAPLPLLIMFFHDGSCWDQCKVVI